VLIETVGAGQAEVDIARLAHTTLVVEAPGMGDEIQAIKAGILEIADILVINKADHPGADNTERALKSMLDLAHPVAKVFQHHGQTMIVSAPKVEVDPSLWIPPIRRTVATEGTGVAELVDSISAHAEHLRQSGDWTKRERARLETELDLMLTESLVTQFRAQLPDSRYDQIVNQLTERTLSPWEAVKSLLNGSKS
jgi:LAO/AO transport system kinase